MLCYNGSCQNLTMHSFMVLNICVRHMSRARRLLDTQMSATPIECAQL